MIKVVPKNEVGKHRRKGVDGLIEFASPIWIKWIAKFEVSKCGRERINRLIEITSKQELSE